MLIYNPIVSHPGYRGASYPGFAMPGRGDERTLRAGEAVRLDLAEGDLISVINVEGASIALLIPFTEDGTNAPSLLGLEAEGMEPIGGSGFDRRALDAWIASRGGDHSQVLALPVFDNDTSPNEQFAARVQSAGSVWLALPVQPQAVALGGSGGQMTVQVQRTHKQVERLPDPIGEIRDEFRIDRATARAYRLSKGEYVQIIDVEGQQCSDFLAVRLDSLHDGVERFIDSTVTRTQIRSAYPTPGLADKFFDQDMRPLLSVVQDTVGRHDTFGLACTARGYEERGFPGHANCSDNISNAIAPHGVGRRAAWPAINFFFNSWILPGDNRFASDEAWSRPGDYVAMQALTDLVCVSTACPDDVDPINGWNPTDIHVRIYKPDQPIRRAVAFRAEPHSEAILTEESAFHARTSRLTRSFHVARDHWLPASYEATRAIDEYWACREAVTVQDMSALRKFDVMGPDAEALLQLALTRNIGKVAINRGTYALMLDETGSVIDDGTLFRLAPEVFRWCCGSDESGRQLKDLAQAKGYKVWIKSLSAAMPNLAIQGPKSRDLLRKTVFTQPTHPSLDTLKWFGWTVGRLHDREGAPFLLTRTGFTGELGYELFCNREDALEIWDALLDAGAEFGITPMGNEALDTIRIEAGLMVAGAEFGPEVDALEAGLGFAVDMKKPEFVGREAIARNGEAPRRQLVGLLLDGDEVPSHGDGVFAGRRKIGSITSATRSPMLERSIAMARIATEHASPDTKLEVGRLDGHMKRLGATASSIPFVDPRRERARS